MEKGKRFSLGALRCYRISLLLSKPLAFVVLYPSLCHTLPFCVPSPQPHFTKESLTSPPISLPSFLLLPNLNTEMAKTCIEICILSARGLGRSSSLWKPQWFAVGWIDPNNKYCTKVESSGSPNPTWKTKFSVPIDDRSSNLQGLSLTIEVYRREPIFLREKLQGTATILLKEFFTKFARDEASRSGVEETVSFQLRKRNSGKPHGFVDISIRVFEEKEGVYSHSDFGGDYHYSDSKSDISLAIEDGAVISYPKVPQSQPFNQLGNQIYNQTNYPYPYPTPTPPSHPYQSSASTSEGYRRPPTPPPPPPPSNTGFLPTLFPGTTANRLPETCINMPASRPSGPSAGPGFGMGLGAGALAAGAMIFGDDFLSGSSFPTGLGDGGSFAVSADPMF